MSKQGKRSVGQINCSAVFMPKVQNSQPSKQACRKVLGQEVWANTTTSVVCDSISPLLKIQTVPASLAMKEVLRRKINPFCYDVRITNIVRLENVKVTVQLDNIYLENC